MHYQGVGRSDCCLRQLISASHKLMKQSSSCSNLAFECSRDRVWVKMGYCEWHGRDKLADRIACQSAKAGWVTSGVAAEPTETRVGW